MSAIIFTAAYTAECKRAVSGLITSPAFVIDEEVQDPFHESSNKILLVLRFSTGSTGGTDLPKPRNVSRLAMPKNRGKSVGLYETKFHKFTLLIIY